MKMKLCVSLLGRMKTLSFALAAVLGLMVAVTPGKVQADEVKVTTSLTFTGSATACGGGSCVEKLDASFLWDTTTQSVVSGSISDTATGPINYGIVTISGTSTDLQTKFSDGSGDFLTLGIDLGAGSPVLGTYTAKSGPGSPGSFFLGGYACVSSVCQADLSNGTLSAVSAKVAATPEPGTGLLIVTGLLGLIAVPLARKQPLLRLAILRTVVFVGFVCLAALPTLADGVNIVSDPGFELGTANSYPFSTTPVPMGDGWLVTAGTGAICNNSGAGCGNVGNAHTGAQMAFLDWSNSSNTITQDLTTVIGQTYTISYWVADGEMNFLEVMFGGSTLFDGTAPTNGTYVGYTFDATATSTDTLLAFSGQRTTGRGGTLLDDVSVTANPVPEPTTWALTSVGLLGIVVLRRRHSKICPTVGW